MSHDWAIVFLLMARMPIYIYVIYKAYKFRNSMVLLSSKWLLILGFAGACGALGNAFASPKLVVNIFGTLFSFAMFAVGLTAKEVKRSEKARQQSV